MQQSDFIILSIGYLANEIKNDQYMDKQADVWSLGVMWYQLLTGEIIIKNSNMQLNQHNIDQQIEHIGNQIDQNIKNLLKQMLVIENQNRIQINLLIQQLKQIYSNNTSFNFQNLQYSFNNQTTFNNFTIQYDLENLEKQFIQEFQLLLKKKQTSMKKAMIDIIQEEIHQNIFLLQDFNINNHQEYDMLDQCHQNNLEKWQKLDNLFLQIQQQFQVSINELIVYQEDQIQQRQLEKKKQIRREITWQIKQQLLLDYKFKILLKESKNEGQQTSSYIDFQTFQSKIINNTQNQLNMLQEQVENSIIKIQKQQKYFELQENLNLIKQGMNLQIVATQGAVENIIKFKKQLMNFTIELDSLEHEIELEQLGNKLQRDKITIINKSKNLLKEYSQQVDHEILVIGELKKRNSLRMRQNQQDHYFDDKIISLNIQKQNLIQEMQQLSQDFNNQQIESMLLLIQKIKFFNEKIIKFINFKEYEVKQFKSESQVLQILDHNNNQQKELANLINLLIDQLDIMETYFNVGEIYCKDINILNKQQESINDLFLTLNRQSEYLQQCQSKLQENNPIIESNQLRFDSKNFFKQNCSKVDQDFSFKIQDILNLKEQVRNRLLFYEYGEFFKQIIVSWNVIKTEKEKIQKILQEVIETNLINQTNKDILQEQINKIKGLINQIKLSHQIKPSFTQIQRFNQQYVQNQNSYLELFTLVVYIKQYYNSIFLYIYLSLKQNVFEKLNQQSNGQNQVIINKQLKLKSQIEKSRQQQSLVYQMMEEYLKCLQKKTDTFELAKLCKDNDTITEQNQTLENEIISIIKVKLNGQLNKQFINETNKLQKILEISALFCYNFIIE